MHSSTFIHIPTLLILRRTTAVPMGSGYALINLHPHPRRPRCAYGGSVFTIHHPPQLKLISSTSNINVLFGPICDPVWRSPYARFGGRNNLHLLPVGINCSASVQPLITMFN